LKTNHSSPWLGTLATNGAILLCGMASSALVARLLAPEGRGALAAVLFWPHLLAAIGLLSLNEGIVYRRGQTAADERIFATSAVTIGLALATVTAAAGWFVVPYLLGADRHELVPLARAYLLAFLPLNFLSLVLFALDQSHLRFARYNLLRLLPPYVYLASLVVFWASRPASVACVLFASWLGTFVTLLVQLALIRRSLAARLSRVEARRIAAVACRFHSASLLFLVGSRLDQMVVLGYWDDRSLGYYVVAVTVAGTAVAVLTNSFHIVLFPRISAAPAVAEKVRLLDRGLRHSNLLIGTTTIALIVLVPWLVPLLFGPAFAPATLPAVILLLAGWPLALRQIIARSLRGFGESRSSLLAETWALGLFVAVAGPLAAIGGLAGVALASLVANAAALSYLTLVLRRRFALRLADWHGFSRATVSELGRSALVMLRRQILRDRWGGAGAIALRPFRSWSQ
jgi:O-antigen/teichoic acid export membrane protein